MNGIDRVTGKPATAYTPPEDVLRIPSGAIFIEPDFDGDPTLWLGSPEDVRPSSLVNRSTVGREAWSHIATALNTLEAVRGFLAAWDETTEDEIRPTALRESLRRILGGVA